MSFHPGARLHFGKISITGFSRRRKPHEEGRATQQGCRVEVRADLAQEEAAAAARQRPADNAHYLSWVALAGGGGCRALV